jgi:hypothetical protein
MKTPLLVSFIENEIAELANFSWKSLKSFLPSCTNCIFSIGSVEFFLIKNSISLFDYIPLKLIVHALHVTNVVDVNPEVLYTVPPEKEVPKYSQQVYSELPLTPVVVLTIAPIEGLPNDTQVRSDNFLFPNPPPCNELSSNIIFVDPVQVNPDTLESQQL